MKNSQPPLVRFEDIPAHVEPRTPTVDQGTNLQRFVEGPPTGKLMVAEEVETGHVEKLACKSRFSSTYNCVDFLRVTVKLYISSLSRYPIIFWVAVIGAILFNETSIALQSWFLGVWATQYEHHPASEVSVS